MPDQIMIGTVDDVGWEISPGADFGFDIAWELTDMSEIPVSALACVIRPPQLTDPPILDLVAGGFIDADSAGIHIHIPGAATVSLPPGRGWWELRATRTDNSETRPLVRGPVRIRRRIA